MDYLLTDRVVGSSPVFRPVYQASSARTVP